MVGRPTTGVTSVTLRRPRMWWKANYRCKMCNVVWTRMCNVVWAKDVEGRPTTGVTSVTLCGPRMWREGQPHV